MPDASLALAATPASIATNGPLLLAVGVAALAGLLSFLSPCVLPLVPGYLSYLTGLAGADLTEALHHPTARSRGRIVVGTLGFVAGFSTVFTLTSVLATGVGRFLLVDERVVEVLAGVVIIVLGLAFAGLIPGLQREWRVSRLPAAGLASAPVLGAVFALSWLPCIGPTLGAIMTLSLVEGSSARTVTLAVAYCLGLGVPFLAFGLGFRRLIGVVRVIRQHNNVVTWVGGMLLVLVGLALATGLWHDFVTWLQASVGSGSVLM
jgi:cytochrome c-type biogenesis protein